MTKIKFSNGVVVNFNGTPTKSDIEEIAKKVQQSTPTKKQPEKQGFFSRVGSFIKKDIFGGGASNESKTFSGGLGKDIFQSTIGSKGLAGVGQIPGKVIGQKNLEKDKTALSKSKTGLADQTMALIDSLDDITNPERKKRLQEMIKSNMATLGENTSYKELEKQTVTPRDTISTWGNAALTALTGSGSVTKKLAIAGAKSLPIGSKVATGIYKTAKYGKGIVPRALEQGALSAGFQASQNIKDSKLLTENTGTAFGFGLALPFAGAGVSKAKNALPPLKLKASERVINSLIKPLLKDFSYGKNPGRGVAREGIVFNSLEEGAVKINNRLKSIGSQIDEVASKYENEVLDLSDVLKPIDQALAKAKETPRTNSVLIQRLQDAKNDLMGVIEEADGVITITKDLSQMTFPEAVTFKRLIGDITKFTGNASDDKLMNTALKRAYGSVKGKVNKIAPEMIPLNERWADLKSAEIAVKYRDKIEMRQNLIKFAPKILGGGLSAVGISTLNPALVGGAILTYGLDALLGSAGFKTRFAKWLAKSSVKERNELIRQAPVIKNILDRIFGDNSKSKSTKIKTYDFDYIEKAIDDYFEKLKNNNRILPKKSSAPDIIPLKDKYQSMKNKGSYVKGVDAKKTFGRDTGTGKFKRVYNSN